MRTRSLWIVLTLFILPPVLVTAAWRTLPKADVSGRCGSVASIVPDESASVAFSVALRSEILDNAGGPFQLRVTDTQLTSYVALNLHGRQLADPQIHFLDEAVCFSGHLVGLGFLRPRFRVEARPYVNAGDIQVAVREFTVNGRALPAWLKRLAQRVANESVRDASLPVQVETLRLTAGEILIAGRRLPTPR